MTAPRYGNGPQAHVERTARPWSPILVGRVGSHAHGLSTPKSDVDLLGVSAAHTTALVGLYPLNDHHGTIVTHEPDCAIHEAGKFVRLCLGSNPSALELLYLDQASYRVITPAGYDLINIRHAFLSATKVEDAYIGYAVQQFGKLSRRDDGTFSSDVRNRTAKHARHIMRLLDAGVQLYTTGEMLVKVEDPQRYHDFGALVANERDSGLEVARGLIERARAAISGARSPLPDEPDRPLVEDWLLRVRKESWT